MGTIDEAYANNNNGNEQPSSALINRTKYPTMIPSTVQNHNLTPSEVVKDESLTRLKYESSRLSTFDKWPASAKVEPRKIAKAGFFYTGQYAEAKCLWCGCVITTWEYGDQVMTRHRSASPDCPFVRDVSDNIPLLTSTTSSNNITSPHSEEQHVNNESPVDRIDYGHHGGSGNNSNSGTTNSSTETENNDEVGDNNELYTRRISEDTRRMSATRTATDPRMVVGSDRASPSQGRTGGSWHHPNSGRRLSGDFASRPTINSPMSPDINDDIYKYESERLKTFEHWPISFIRPADLANSGFVYTGRGDCVRCVFCREHVGDWDEDDFPHTEHRSLFPHCPFVRGLDVGNIAGHTEMRGATQDRLGLVHSQSQHGNFLSARNDTSREVTPNRGHHQPFRRNSSNVQSRGDMAGHVRLRPNSGRNNTSYQRQHSDQPQRPRSTSYDTTINYNAFDRNIMEHPTRPQSMATSGEIMEESYDEAGIRPRSGGPEKGILQLLNNGRSNKQDGATNQNSGASSSAAGQPEDIGIIRHSGPANAKYSTVEARTRTFREWPPALRQQPAQLSEAGFFYIGLSDQVKCFYCDGGLRNWQPEDDPWTEHARWFSECGFVRLVKGDEFISKCINSHPPVSVPGVPVVKQSRDLPRNTIGEDQLQQMMSSPLVHQVLAMGIDPTKVKKALKQRIQETGSGFKFASELVEATVVSAAGNSTAISMEHTHSVASRTEAASGFSAAGPSTANPSVSSQPQVPLTESQSQSSNVDPNHLTTEISNMLAFGATTNRAENSDINQSANINSRTCTSAPGTLETNNQVGPGGNDVSRLHPVPQGMNDKKVVESSVELEIENRRLKDQRTCKICMDREIGVVFLPCGHLISCVNCAPALKDCPLCRQPISGTVKTYMS